MKPDLKEIAKGLNDLVDLKNHFTLSIKYEPFISSVEGEPDKTYDMEINRILYDGTKEHSEELLKKHFTECQSKPAEFKGDISAFTKYEIDQTNRLIDEAKKVTRIDKSTYLMASSYINYLEKRSIQRNPKDDSSEGINKPYKSKTRARAFCIYQMYLNKKIAEDIFSSKLKLIKRIEQEFPKLEGDIVNSGKTVYEALRTGKNPIHLNFTKVKEVYPDDYNYGLELYKMKYPDS
jgi:hypothetical protein